MLPIMEHPDPCQQRLKNPIDYTIGTPGSPGPVSRSLATSLGVHKITLQRCFLSLARCPCESWEPTGCTSSALRCADVTQAAEDSELSPLVQAPGPKNDLFGVRGEGGSQQELVISRSTAG